MEREGKRKHSQSDIKQGKDFKEKGKLRTSYSYKQYLNCFLSTSNFHEQKGKYLLTTQVKKHWVV